MVQRKAEVTAVIRRRQLEEELQRKAQIEEARERAEIVVKQRLLVKVSLLLPHIIYIYGIYIIIIITIITSIITIMNTLFLHRGKVRLQTSCSKGCQNPTPCWTRQIQARPNHLWARCSVFISPPASRGRQESGNS